MLYLCRGKPLRHYLRGFLIAAWAGDKIAEFSFPEISFHFSLRPWFFFVSPAYAGKRKTAWKGEGKKRITPACAGKRDRNGIPLILSQDHPRVCGEKSAKAGGTGGTGGSPPRVRGKACCTNTFVNSARITPACAGKSNMYVYGPLSEVGSPPRVRGKGSARSRRRAFSRITPACAGKRLRKSHNSAIFPCHVTRFH